MLNIIRISLKNSLVYGIGNIAVKVIGLLLIPLYTNRKYFTVDDFGIIALLEISGIILISLMASGLPQGMMRWYWDKSYMKDQKGIFFMSFVFQIIIGIFFCVLLLPLSSTISGLIFSTPDLSRAIELLILSAALQSVNNLIGTLMQVQSKPVLFTITNSVKLLIVLSLTIFLIVNRHMGIEGIYMAQVAGNLLFIVLLSVYSLRNLKPYFNFGLFRQMSSYGFPLLLANFAAAVFAAVDRYSLNSLALLKYVALYSLAFKLASVLKLVIVDSVKTAIRPIVLQKIDDPDNHRFYSKTLLYSSYLLMIGIITVSLFSYEVIKVISKSTEFWNAFVIIPLLCLSVFFVNMRETSSYGLLIKKRTGIVGINVVVSTIINIFLNILLIPKFDIMGAALATMLTQMIYWYLNFYFSQKEYYIPYESRKIVILFFSGAIFSFVGLLINDMPLVFRILIKSACIFSWPFVLSLLNFYEVSEIQAIRGFFRKWANPAKLTSNLKSLRNIKNDIDWQ